MSTQFSFRSIWRGLGVSISIAAVALLVFGATPAAADHIQTPAQLRDACEQSPGNVVTLDHPTKVFLPGPGQSTLVAVASGCTLVLGPGAKLEAEFAPLSFAGPLVIESAQQTEVKLVKSLFRATSITLNLTGQGSALGSSESTLEATTGNLIIALGDESKLEMVNRLLPGPANGLFAAGMIQISGGRKFTGLLNENSVYGAQGISISMNDGDGLLKVEQILFSTPQGGVSITASGAKALLEMSESGLQVRDGVVLSFTGSDASINMKQTSLGGSGGVAPNGVIIEAGIGSAINGKIELSEVSIFDIASVTVQASLSGEKGVLKMEKSNVSAQGDVRLETGVQGSTAVKENQLASGTLVRIAAGPSGSCLAQPNSISSLTPVIQLCP